MQSGQNRCLDVNVNFTKVSEDTDNKFSHSPVRGVSFHANQVIPQAIEIVLQFRKSILCVKIGNHFEMAQQHG